MDYGPFFSATLEVAPGNIANKGIAVRLDPDEGGVARGREFILFETDTLRCAAGWTGPEFIDWKNIALDGTHAVHARILGQTIFSNPDAPGWADPSGRFEDQRILGRDGNHYGPLPRRWAHWRGLFVHGQHVVFSYTVGETDVLESPGAEGGGGNRALTRTFNVGPRSRPLTLQVARGAEAFRQSASDSGVKMRLAATASLTVALAGGPEEAEWITQEDHNLRLHIPAGPDPIRFKLLYLPATDDGARQAWELAKTCLPPIDLARLTKGGPARWNERVTTKVQRIFDARHPYLVESITLPFQNPYHSWMRTSAFDFFADGRRAAVSTWQGDVWLVDGMGGELGAFNWRRIAAGLFQPLGLKIVDDRIYVTCRDQITLLRDLNGDGETDFYENFNNDAQVTEHFHEFATGLQTDREGNFYYAKGACHAKEAVVPQHGTVLRVSKDGSKTEILASGFRAPNGICVSEDGTCIISDQEGHWTPENRINWIKPGAFYGYMMGFHEPRGDDDFEPPVVWIHKSLDRSPAEQVWVAGDKWGLPEGSLLTLSYGTGKILQVFHERIGDVIQGGVMVLPIAAMATGIMRGRFHPGDGQLYVAGLFGWSGDRTRPGGFYRVRYTGKPLHLPVALEAKRQGMLITFNGPLDPETAGDPDSYAVTRWTLNRTANYGSDDYSLTHPGQRGRDTVEVTGARLSPDSRSVLLEIPDMQPCMQMEIKCNIRAADGARIAQLIQNTINVVGGDCPFVSKR